MKNKGIDEVVKNLEEQKLVKVNPDNTNEARLTKKGLEEINRWKGRNREMDFLLFLCEGISKKIKEVMEEKEKNDEDEKVGWFKKFIGG